MSRTLARIIRVRSDSIENLMPAGTQRLQLGQQRVDAVDRVDHVGVGLLGDDEEHGGMPLNQAAERLLRVLCSMVAIDPSSVTAPFADLTTMLRYSAGSRIWALAAMVWAMPSPSNSPTGPAALALTMASAHVLHARCPWWRSRPG